jgi:PAS domain S-box-containing protein
MKEQLIRLLHLEDVAADAKLAEFEIRKVLPSSIIRVVESKPEFISELEQFNPHIVISDFKLPSFDGLSALKIVLEKSPLTPVIILTGSMNEDTAVECMKAGATDYVTKGHSKRLGQAVLHALEKKENKLLKKRAEEALIQSEENFHRSIADSPMGIRVVTIDGRTIYTNKAFLDIYGFDSIEEFTNTPAKERYIPECYVEHQARKQKRKNGQEVNEYEVNIIRKDSEIRIIKVLRKEVLWNGSKHYQVMNRDITEQRNLTRDLIAAKEKAEESDRLKTAFLHNISHEVRTPMNAIIGFSKILQIRNNSPEKLYQLTEIIAKSSYQLLSIITDIITISTIDAGQEKINDQENRLNSILKRSYDQFLPKGQAKNIELNLILALADEEDHVLLDDAKFVQILNNLIDNALKFTLCGQITFGYRIKHTELEFFVEDSGIGIEPGMHEEIFKRFRQVEIASNRQFGGSGLGLSISKAYIELLGGRIWLRSEIGKGSTFYFTIPYQKVLQKVQVQNRMADNPDFEITEVLTVLIAEDEDSNFILIKEMLSGLNINIFRAINGVEAIEICRSRPIDLILMDIKMPIMDGYKASIRIREFMANVPIIALTAYTSFEDKDKALACGCNDFVSKPVEQEQLISKIREQFAGK